MTFIGHREDGPRLPRVAEPGPGVGAKFIWAQVLVDLCNWGDCPERLPREVVSSPSLEVCEQRHLPGLRWLV